MPHPSKNQRLQNRLNRQIDILNSLPAADKSYIALATSQLEVFIRGRQARASGEELPTTRRRSSTRRSRSRSPRQSTNRNSPPLAARSSRYREHRCEEPVSRRQQEAKISGRASIEKFIEQQGIRAQQIIESRAERGAKVLQELAEDARFEATAAQLRHLAEIDRDDEAYFDTELYGDEADPSKD